MSIRLSLVCTLGGLTWISAGAQVAPVGQAGPAIRAYVEKKERPPTIVLDLTTGKMQSTAIARMPYCEVEVDGVWYVPARGQLVAGYMSVGPGRTIERYSSVRLSSDFWVRKQPSTPVGRSQLRVDAADRLQLTAAKHTVRVACRVGADTALSQPVEVEVPAVK